MIYDNAQLNEIGLETINSVSSYMPWAADALTICYLSGCRPNELFGVPRWSIQSLGVFRLQPSKGNLAREIIGMPFPEYAIDNILAAKAPFWPYSERRLLMYFKKFRPSPKLFCGNRDIETYIYRHLYIRELYALGLTPDQIALEMGYSTTSVVSGYINSVIYSI
jgi:hypothetical protein